MGLHRKLRVLADSAKYDASCASSGVLRNGSTAGLGNSDGTGICHSYTPDGRCVSLLKILLTNFCIYDCAYCVNRISNDVERARFSVEEVVSLTLDFYRRNYIEGLFLSSGVIHTPDYTMDRLTTVARRLRVEHAFNGYIHLKAMPGASRDALEEAGRWADRLSVNIELPTGAEMRRFAPDKRHESIELAMHQIRERAEALKPDRKDRAEAPRFVPAGQTTQMIVGAGASTDREILETSMRLYERHRLRRVYYSAYSPIEGTDASLPPAAPPLAREHRLYQADYLLRHYGYHLDELIGPGRRELERAVDPKLAWALRNPAEFPVDVNVAPRERLLRVPGLGRRAVSRILTARRHQRLALDDLRRLCVRVRVAAPFLETADRRRASEIDRMVSNLAPAPGQLALFPMSA